MNTQNRLSVTLSPRMRKALELCANLDGSNSASYAAILLTNAITQEIAKNPALYDRLLAMEREALIVGKWPHSSNDEEGKPGPVVPGWALGGNISDGYEIGVEDQGNGKKSATLKSTEPWVDGFGTLMQHISASEYVHRRLRYSALVKTRDINGWVGLWMRIDAARGEVLMMDNMQTRSIKGTTDWKRYDVVLDVPENAALIAFGMLLDGGGQAWISDVQLEMVGEDVPLSQPGDLLSTAPVNLNFAL